MHRLLYLLFLTIAAGASAQQMPERAHVRKGNRLYNKGEYARSIERYEQALEAAPGSFEAGYDLGNALYKAERYDHAEQTLQKVATDTLRTPEERAHAYYNLGNAQFKQEKYKEALESYKQSLRLVPSDMETKYNYAYTKRLLDQNKDGGGGQDQQQNQQGQDQQNQDRQQGDQQKDQQDQQGQQDKEQQDHQQGQSQPEPDEGNEGEGEAQPAESAISPQEQEQMLEAIQAQEDRTQEKLNKKRGVVVRGNKNW